MTYPSAKEYEEALREIAAVLKACEEGEMPIAEALDTINALSGYRHLARFVAALDDRAERRGA